ncbi:hypothetical protein B296_00039828 [Ensete ventricosum]|uniref:Uncharacterized protein n=1 Tax=Ensete ventricosum TaxID=4639 RepID=A0A426YHW3_ENSVE|nr:hypothetical protein B296_00039828 [Ensete ventricosum]
MPSLFLCAPSTVAPLRPGGEELHGPLQVALQRKAASAPLESDDVCRPTVVGGAGVLVPPLRPRRATPGRAMVWRSWPRRLPRFLHRRHSSTSA